MASFLHYVGCDFKRCLKSAVEDQGRQNEEKDERFLEKHDTETNDGKDSSSPFGSFRGCNNQSSASIWPNHPHPLTSSTDFLLFLLGLLPASSNLSILLLIYSINVHPLYMSMHFHCYSLLPPKKPQHFSSACWRFSTDTISNPVKSLPLCTPFLSFLLIFCYRISHLSPFSTRINLYVHVSYPHTLSHILHCSGLETTQHLSCCS